VGATPGGLVNYVLQAYGRCPSDRQVAIHIVGHSTKSLKMPKG